MNNNSFETPTNQASDESLDFDVEPPTRPEPISEPAVDDTTVSPIRPPAPKSRRPLTVALAAVVVVILLGSGAAAYKLWYQNPERVVTTALVKLLQSESINSQTIITSDSELSTGLFSVKMKKLELVGNGSLASATGETDAKLLLELNGRDYSVGAKARLADDKTIYFQLVDIKNLVTKLADDFSGGAIELPADSIKQLESIQNKWVKVTAEDMGEEAETINCLIDTAKRVSKDSKYGDEAKRFYMENKFLEIGDEVAAANGNLGYKVTINQAKFKQYSKASEGSMLAKEIKKCPGYDQVADSDAGDESPDLAGYETPTTSVTVWVSRFGHELKQVDYKIKSKQSQTAKEIVFNGQTKLSYKPLKVEKPDQSVTLKAWQAEVERYIESMQAAYMSGMLDEATAQPAEFSPETSV